MNEHLNNLLEEALESSEIAWWEWDFKKNLVLSNDLKTTMLGYKPGSFKDAGYQAYTDLLHPDDFERTMQAMRDHLEGRAAIYQVDYRILRADGHYTWYMDRGRIIERDHLNNPLKLRGIVMDLGETLMEKSRDEAILKLIRQTLALGDSNEKFIVLCSSCKKIQISNNIWMPVNGSFERGLLEKISHGICHDCLRQLYPEEADDLI